MSIESVITNKLVSCGLFNEQAAVIMAAVKDDPANKAMGGRWADDTEGYPPQIMTLAWMSAVQHALEWIDANLPNAWYRSYFAELCDY